MTARLSPERLLDFATEAYASAGMPEADARIVADTLARTDLEKVACENGLRAPF